MFSRRPGARFNRGRVGTSAAAPDSWDLTALASASSLLAWWDAGSGVTMSATPLATGTTPPTVTFSGPGLSSAAGRGIYIRCNDNSTFRWNAQNGWGIGRGVGETAVAIPKGSSYELPGTGVTAAFTNATYNSGHQYVAVAESWASLVGSAVLDNSTVYAARGFVIGAAQSFNDCRPSMLVSPTLGTGGLGTTDAALLAAMSGANKPFHIFLVHQITSSNISTLPVAAWSFSHSTTTTSNFLDARWYGPDATTGPAGAGAQHMIQRRAPSEAAVQKGALTSLNFGPEILEYAYDGTNLYGWINGVPLWSAFAWSSGSLTLQRFLLGVVKLGTNAASNISHDRIVSCAIYNTKLAESTAGRWGVLRALA